MCCPTPNLVEHPPGPGSHPEAAYRVECLNCGKETFEDCPTGLPQSEELTMLKNNCPSCKRPLTPIMNEEAQGEVNIFVLVGFEQCDCAPLSDEEDEFWDEIPF